MKKAVSIILSIVMMVSVCIISAGAEGNDTLSSTQDYAVTQIIERNMIGQTNKSGIYADEAQTFTLFVSPSDAEPSAPQQILVENDKIMIRNSVDNEGVLSWGEWRILNDPAQQNPNAEYVICDGNNDELKIQKAINNGVKVVYPIGTCVLTNENTSFGDGELSEHQVVVNLKQDVTLDGMYCDELIFKNSAPADKQVIFQLADGAKLKNIKMREEECTVDTVNPMIISGGDCEVSDCVFTDLYDPCGMHGMYFHNAKFINNTIDGWSLNLHFNATFSFYCKDSLTVENNTFKNIISVPKNHYTAMGIYGTEFKNNKFLNCNFQNGVIVIDKSMSGNSFSDIEEVRFELRSNTSGNDFLNINNATFRFSGPSTCGNFFTGINNVFFDMYGVVSGNKFTRLSSEDLMFRVQSSTMLVNNVFQGCTINGYCAFEMSSNSSLCNNQLIGFHFLGYNEQYMLYLWNDDAIISGNNIKKVKTSNPDENYNICVVDSSSVNGTICANNITTYNSMGEFTDTCKVVNNIVEEESTN